MANKPSERFFLQMFEKHGIKLLEKCGFETPKSRLRPQDAKRFLEWSCKNYKSFYAPDIKMRSHEEIPRKFREFIEKYGIRERRSKFILHACMLTGAGGGGCMIALCYEEKLKDVLEAVEHVGGTAFIARKIDEDVRIEH